MATIDEDLGQIEKDIRQLKIEYDQYFGGGRKRPPTEIEWRIDLLVKRYNERGGELKSHQRFRFNNLTQTYAKYKDVFRKKTKQKEEGTIQRHFGAAAKEIEAKRAKEHEKEAAAAAAAGNSKAFRMVCSKPESEPEKVEKLYEAFLQAIAEAPIGLKCGGTPTQPFSSLTDAHQRLPELLLLLRGRSSRGLASLTVRVRPSDCWPFRVVIAAWASWSLVISTNPNPLDRPVSRSMMTCADFTAPCGVNICSRAPSVTP